MPSSRYHIHIIEVSGHEPAIDSQLALFLEDKAFITRDLLLINNETANYSRRCIDACDFVIMVISDSYGNTNVTGVSQLHLSYLTVKTKRKPILILIKSPSQVERSRQLLDFIDTVEQRGPQQLYYFQDVQSFSDVLVQSYRTMSEMVPKQRWVKNANVNPKKVPFIPDDTVGFNDNKKSDNMTKRLKSDFSTLLDDTNFGDEGIQSISSELSSQASQSTTKNKSTQNKSLTDKNNVNTLLGMSATGAPITDLDTTNDASSDIEVLTESTQELPKSVVADQDLYRLTHGSPQQVSPNQAIDLTYDAHAYQDGNIKDVVITTSMTWMEILYVLEKLNDVFSSETMYRTLNYELAQSAPKSVAKILPKAHAVTRCTIRRADFAWIQDQLVFNGWLKLVNQKVVNQQVTNRDSWQLTDKALKILLSDG